MADRQDHHPVVIWFSAPADAEDFSHLSVARLAGEDLTVAERQRLQHLRQIARVLPDRALSDG